MARTSFAITSVFLCVGAALASESGGGGGSLLIQPQFGTIFWTVITFVILLLILGRFAWKPLLGAVQARERGIEESLATARSEREEAQRLLEEHRALLQQARRERAEAVEAGRKDAERVRTEILEEARKQREALVRQGETQIEAGVRQARMELKRVAADLAIQAAGKLLGQALDGDAQRRLVEEYIADLERMSSSSPPH